MDTLTESRFEMLADETLNRMVDSLDDNEDDAFDASLESGVLTISFADGAKFVINSHRAARQIWMAAGTTAWHFDWTGKAWISTRSQDELWGTLGEKMQTKLGRPLKVWPQS
ncbi:MAG: iron donor protein CyaY [Myxococcota bacterium]